MPYGKRKRHSAYGARRGYRKKRKSSTKAQIARVVQDILKVEKKHFTLGYLEASASAGVTHIDQSVGLFDIRQGTNANQRVGSQIKLTDVFWRWNLNNALSVTNGTAETIRLWIMLDKQCNGAHGSTTLMFSDNDYQTYNNIENKRRFRTLYDSGPIGLHKTGAAMSTVDVLTAIPTVKNGEVYLKNLNLMIDYDADGGLETDLTSNAIYFIIGAHIGGQAQLDSLVRFKYTDV